MNVKEVIRARLVGLAPPLKGATDRFLRFPVSPATGLVFSDVAAWCCFPSTDPLSTDRSTHHDQLALSPQALAPEDGDAIQDERHPTAQVARRLLRAG